MKRYKDCELVCNEGQDAYDLLEIVEKVAQAYDYRTNRQSTISNKDTLVVYTKEAALPYSRIIICPLSEGEAVYIANIVPMPESGTSHIDHVVYNQLLDIFRESVFADINAKYGNAIRGNEEDYTLEDIIPISYPKLRTWLAAYPLSGHPLDTCRWYDFVLSLHLNQEHLSLDDFRKYIEENYGWEEDDLNRFELKLESQLDLLEYYDEHR